MFSGRFGITFKVRMALWDDARSLNVICLDGGMMGLNVGRTDGYDYAGDRRGAGPPTARDIE